MFNAWQRLLGAPQLRIVWRNPRVENTLRNLTYMKMYVDGAETHYRVKDAQGATRIVTVRKAV
jgi:hypothetical protein